ncbi:MAG: phosphate/phosphite/phosphonate ABC transporter substrate-binding protein [Psychromonas sp.]|nr:phosphate/phosphite/phosphonate ABC transporter substrate-binding protein [Psychromonas sp.]
MKKLLFTLLLLLNAPLTLAEKSLTFALVPQQSASKLAKLWTPIFEEITLKSGIKIKFATAPDIPTFEKRLAEGEYDIAYMNPYHYVVFNKSNGYQALAKARDKRIKGIIVVAKDNSINSLEDLNNTTLAFPAPAAFAATILTQSDLSKTQAEFSPRYVSSHDSVYRTVAKGIYPAGGGVLRTFNNVAPDIKDKLRVLWTTKGYTPHAIATHPRVTPEQAKKIQIALVEMEQTKSGKALLNNIKIKGFETANNADWDDIRELNISTKIAE